MKTKMPLKMSILKAVADSGPAGAEDIIGLLSPDYGKERQFRKAAIENHLMSLRAVGLIEDAPGGGMKFMITAAGQVRLA